MLRFVTAESKLLECVEVMAAEDDRDTGTEDYSPLEAVSLFVPVYSDEIQQW